MTLLTAALTDPRADTTRGIAAAMHQLLCAAAVAALLLQAAAQYKPRLPAGTGNALLCGPMATRK